MQGTPDLAMALTSLVPVTVHLEVATERRTRHLPEVRIRPTTASEVI